MKTMVKHLIALTLGALIMVAAPVRAVAQPNPQDQMIPSLELEQADIRDALKILFNNVGVSYVVDSTVQGTVTVSLHNVAFETALQNILKQVDATYRVEGGVYNVVKKEAEASPVVSGNTLPDLAPTGPVKRLHRIRILHADPALIFELLMGTTNFQSSPEVTLGRSSGGGGGGGGGFGGGGGAGGGGIGGAGGGGGGGGFGGGGGGGIGGGGGRGGGGAGLGG
jgi:hypothetical protein